MESWRIPQEPRLNLLGRFHPLPSHRHAELRDSHEFLGQRHMTREENANSRFAGCFENLNYFSRDLLAILNLLHAPDLHVVDDQSQSFGITNIFQRLRTIQSKSPPHNEFHLAK